MILRSLLYKLRGHDWFTVLAEVFLLAVGLVVAFQVDRWWEQQADREKEQAYILRLADNIEADIPHLRQLIEVQSLRLNYVNLLMEAAENPNSASKRPGEFLAAIIGASYTSYPTLRSYTFEDLRSTGNMALIRSPEVKAALYGYYDYDRRQAYFYTLFLSNEFRHWELAAGVLSPAQAQWLQNNRIFALPANVTQLVETPQDMGEVMATAERLAAKHDLVNWLPQIREMQIYLIFALERQIGQAEEALDVLMDYAGEIGAKPE